MRQRIAAIAGIDAGPGRRQGDDQRAARLHRPRAKAWSPWRPQPCASLELAMIDETMRTLAARLLDTCRDRG